VLGLLESGGVALWVAILSTPVLIRWLRTRGIGQHIREDGPASHIVKAGTPTMGGLAIVTAVVLGYALGHVDTQIRFSRTGYLAVMAVVLFGAIGLMDDWIKVRHKRSLGLNKRAKSLLQVGSAVLFAELALHWAHTSTALSFTRYDVPGINAGDRYAKNGAPNLDVYLLQRDPGIDAGDRDGTWAYWGKIVALQRDPGIDAGDRAGSKPAGVTVG